MRPLVLTIVGLMIGGFDAILLMGPKAVGSEPLNLLDRPLLTLKYPSSRVDNLAFSADGRVLASECFSNIRLTDVKSGKSVQGTRKQVLAMEFSRDGKSLVLGKSGGEIEVLGLPTLVQAQVFSIAEYGVYAIAISFDSARIAADASDGTVQVWDISAAKKLRTLGSEGSRMSALAFSPDGKLLVTLSREGQCNVYDVETGKRLRTSEKVGNDNSILRFSSDGATIAIIGYAMSFWDVRTQQEPTRFLPPEVLIGKPRINGFGFSPNEGRPMNAPLGDFIGGQSNISPDLRTMVSVLENGKLAVWDVVTRKVLSILPIDRTTDLIGGGIESIAFSPDSNLVAIGNRNGVAKVWRLRGNQAPVPGPQPIEIDGLPGPWGQAAINGLRTRLILEAVKPGTKTVLEGPIPEDRKLPISEGVWWRVQLQVRNETDQHLTFALTGNTTFNGLLITHEGEQIAHEMLQEDRLVTKKRACKIQPHDFWTIGSIMLGRNHDMSKPGKYRIQFPETTVTAPFPMEITNPVLPASNVLEFENAPMAAK